MDIFYKEQLISINTIDTKISLPDPASVSLNGVEVPGATLMLYFSSTIS